jgi:tetratricopeptide (TPR) repeat protein
MSLLPDGIFTTPLSKLTNTLSTFNRDRLEALESKSDWKGVIAFAEEQLKREPTSGDWWYVKGSAEVRMGAWRAARASFNEAVRYAPDDLDGWYMLAQSQGQTGDRAGAIRTLRQALEVSSDAPRTHFFLGEELRRGGRSAEAREAYFNALRIQPEFPEALYGLALAQVRLGERDAANRTIDALERQSPALATRVRQAI